MAYYGYSPLTEWDGLPSNGISGKLFGSGWVN